MDLGDAEVVHARRDAADEGEDWALLVFFVRGAAGVGLGVRTSEREGREPCKNSETRKEMPQRALLLGQGRLSSFWRATVEWLPLLLLVANTRVGKLHFGGVNER